MEPGHATPPEPPRRPPKLATLVAAEVHGLRHLGRLATAHQYVARSSHASGPSTSIQASRTRKNARPPTIPSPRAANLVGCHCRQGRVNATAIGASQLAPIGGNDAASNTSDYCRDGRIAMIAICRRGDTVT